MLRHSSLALARRYAIAHRPIPTRHGVSVIPPRRALSTSGPVTYQGNQQFYRKLVKDYGPGMFPS